MVINGCPTFSLRIILEKMNSVLEEQRRLHEERERLEDAMSKEFMLKKSSVSK